MYKLFSERKRESEGLLDDTYKYDCFPEQFRNQVYHLLKEWIGNIDAHTSVININSSYIWCSLCSSFAEEKGMKYIGEEYYRDTGRAYEEYSDSCCDVDYLDLLDFTFAFLYKNYRNLQYDYANNYQSFADEAIKTLNYRLKQHSLGYEFVEGQLIEKTNEQIHREIIKPAIKLLQDDELSGANQEYMEAFSAYKDGDNKTAILNAIKAFESTMKTICARMGYTFDAKKDTAKDLIVILETNSFFPSYLNNHMNGIRTTLESGAPTLRNKEAGHGQGPDVVNVPDEYAEYALDLVATSIVFLVKLYNQRKGKRT